MRNVDWSVGEATRLCTVRSLWANNMRDVQHKSVCAFRFRAIALRYDRLLFFSLVVGWLKNPLIRVCVRNKSSSTLWPHTKLTNEPLTSTLSMVDHYFLVGT